ncbi:hypothetical protein [Kitasatospora kifunensis]|uniref:Lipoprotein n=1 Tax=Kitasatospora kifunensis TaxID=58351 RepID=A0A7W7QXW8_KITKI|nr:hypothetical protein [Kitasatospora kifunensis]MBB4921559.1 hypothetical protein [Kitasatospora kifunensis]
MAPVLKNRLTAVATLTVLLSGLAAGVGTAAYAASDVASASQVRATAQQRGPWDQEVDKKHDRHDGGYYWRESGGVKARWNASHRYWERQQGSQWVHWNGHNWVR